MSSLPRPQPRTSRLDFRLDPDHKALIERAADLEGQTVSNFAMAALIRSAQETIQRASLTTLSARDSKRFLKMLDDEAAPNAALKAAAKRYKASRG